VDEKPFPRLQAAPHEDVGPDGEEGLAERRRFGHGHPLRHRQGVILMREDIFGIAAPREKRGDGIALLPTRDAGADLCHDARCLQTGQIGGAGRWGIASRALERVGAVHTGMVDGDQDLLGHGLGDRPRGGGQDFGTAR
jgi:hypothetical protein